ncbi:hypothetical protein ID866_6414 [Astraeus odoratus]|nr:hypothetical protein ID866_6414 [Astraeus odoratus]
MIFHRNTMSPCYLFRFIILTLLIVRPKPARALRNHQLKKRDGFGVLTLLRTGDLYVTTIQTSSLNEYEVVVDTGSTYTWVGANPNKPYLEGPSSHYTRYKITEKYGSAQYSGRAYIDTITLRPFGDASVLIINDQAVGSAISVAGLPNSGMDGILGLGLTGEASIKDQDGNPIPTVVDNLYNQGVITSAVLGVYCVPQNSGGFGHIAFGNYIDDVITSQVNYVPITRTSPSRNYWGIDAYFTYGTRTILGPTSGTIDSGTNAIHVPHDTFVAYCGDISVAQVDLRNWVTITIQQYNDLQTLSIVIGGQPYDLSPNAQILPRTTTSSPISLIIRSTVQPSGLGDDFSLGHPFIQRYYVVFNATSSQVGFASTHYTNSQSN